MKKLKILALEPYYGGSHKAFIDRIISNSEHSWTLLTLPAYKWKWRMLHSAYTFAQELKINSDFSPDIIFCSDMINLVEFKGFMPNFSSIPSVVYFHENQLAYPKDYDSVRDRTFEWINITTALGADFVWFNSNFHLNLFLEKVAEKARIVPDYRPLNAASEIKAKALVVPQIIKQFPPRSQKRLPGPLRILWAARWEHDKNPEDFFQALRIIRDKGVDFRLNVLGGGNVGTGNKIFSEAEIEFSSHIDNWGFVEDAAEYKKVLLNSDIVVSTAIHEFFGISIAEAAAAGAFPVLPKRLAYPEIFFQNDDDLGKLSFFYEETKQDLANKIIEINRILEDDGSIWQGDATRAIRKVSHFLPENVIAEIDLKMLCYYSQSTKYQNTMRNAGKPANSINKLLNNI